MLGCQGRVRVGSQASSDAKLRQGSQQHPPAPASLISHPPKPVSQPSQVVDGPLLGHLMRLDIGLVVLLLRLIHLIRSAARGGVLIAAGEGGSETVSRTVQKGLHQCTLPHCASTPTLPV